jgi:chemotaxis protein methyltransferase WspC
MSGLSPHVLQQLIELLQERIGLNAESIGTRTVTMAAHTRMNELRLERNEAAFLERVRTQPEQWQQFIEEIIVPESWFFREVTPFECLRSLALQIRNASTTKKLRILSIPCSRGEEPYSIAMTLLDLGFASSQFEVLGCDLSLRSLDFARRGLYRKIAFRETDGITLRLVQQYFTAEEEEYRLHAQVKSAVTFRHENLASHDFLSAVQPFDAIFCRNVLIYLTTAARDNALRHFRRLLNPGGLLYLGHSECRLGAQAGCLPWDRRFPASFRWPERVLTNLLQPFPKSTIPHKPTTLPPQKETAAPAVGKTTHTHTSAPPAPVSLSAAGAVPTSQPASGSTADSLFTRAQNAANAGQLEEAESYCNALLQQNPLDVAAICLLGVVQQSRNQLSVAETLFQKALYLDPEHFEALTHLKLLSEMRGDAQQTANYTRRLDRRLGQGK